MRLNLIVFTDFIIIITMCRALLNIWQLVSCVQPYSRLRSMLKHEHFIAMLATV